MWQWAAILKASEFPNYVGDMRGVLLIITLNNML